MIDAEHRTPGQLLKALLDEREWTQRILAIVLGIDETIINKVVADKRSIDADLAIRLESVFGVDAARFLELQKTYDLAIARISSRPDPNAATRAHLFGALPVSEMIRRGWLQADSIRDLPKVEVALKKFFGASSVSDIETLPHAAKKTAVATPATPVQIAWLYRVKQIANGMLTARYSPASARSAAKRLADLRTSADEVRHVPRILAECGIRYVIVETLGSAKIDGVCFWLDDFTPVIGMSLRHDRIDNFWFVLRHELEHVIQRHGGGAVMLDSDLEAETENVTEEEMIANDAAADFCAPRVQVDRFIARKNPLFSERDVIGFARTLKVHPGLVAGQLRHRTGRFNIFANHLVKVRSIVTPNAMVDGWGDVAPID